MRAVLLAAGFGTRLRPLTEDRPKALLDLAGQPVIDHVLDRILEAESIRGEVVVVTNARFRGHFEGWRGGLPSAKRDRVRVVSNDVTEASERRGAVADLRLGLDAVTRDSGVLGSGSLESGARDSGAQESPSADPLGYVVIAADNVFGFSLDALVAELREREGTGAVVAVHDPEPLEDLSGRSVACVHDAGRVTRIQEKADEPECRRRIAAIYAFGPDLPDWIDRFLARGGDPDSPGYLLEWLADTHRSGVRVAAFPIPGYRFDVGTPERLRAARAFFEGRGGLSGEEG